MTGESTHSLRGLRSYTPQIHTGMPWDWGHVKVNIANNCVHPQPHPTLSISLGIPQEGLCPLMHSLYSHNYL